MKKIDGITGRALPRGGGLKALLAGGLLLLGTGAGRPPQGREASAERLPGRRIAAEALPDTVRRLLEVEFGGRVHTFRYRRDGGSYYACMDGGYVLFSERGEVRGFRFAMLQPSERLMRSLPPAVRAYLREHYPVHSVQSLLPEEGGWRVELFMPADIVLRFDSRGEPLP